MGWTLELCPLFALAIEPLAEAIRQDVSIVGFRRGQVEDRSALYADDALLFLGDAECSLSSLMSTIKLFGSFSGFVINWDKLVLLPLDAQSVVLPICAQQIRIVPAFKYLGVWVHPKVQDYLQFKLQPLLEKFKLKNKSWCKLPLSVVGRTNLVKMIWAPQLLYIVHNTPVWIPQKCFKKIDSLFRILIWKGKQPRIRLPSLRLPKNETILMILSKLLC